jgi:hypothetical protein
LFPNPNSFLGLGVNILYNFVYSFIYGFESNILTVAFGGCDLLSVFIVVLNKDALFKDALFKLKKMDVLLLLSFLSYFFPVGYSLTLFSLIKFFLSSILVTLF